MPSAFTYNQKIYRLPCDCGCTMIEFSEDPDEPFDNDLYVSFKVDAFYEKQMGLKRTIKQRLKLIWLIARGREFTLYEIVVGKREFKDWLKNEFLSE